MRLRAVIAIVGWAILVPAIPSVSETLESEDDRIIYALGLAVARNLSQFALSDGEVKVLSAGIADALAGRTPRVDMAVYGPKIEGLSATRKTRISDQQRTASRPFLEAAAAEKGARTTDSGLIFRETQAGTGSQPVATDTVEVHYHGTLRDGTVFDSSVDRGEPAKFPLNRVISCWTEGLQLMHVGGKATLTCPAEIAYGDRGAPGGKIKPGAALRFDVELLSIESK